MMLPVFPLCCVALRCAVRGRDVLRRRAERERTVSTVPRSRTEALLPVALRCGVMRCGMLWCGAQRSAVMHDRTKRLRSACHLAGRPQLFCAVLIVSPVDLHLPWMPACFCGACWRFVWRPESRVWHRAPAPDALSDRRVARYP